MRRRLWEHISPRHRKQLGLLLFVMVVTSFVEAGSIGAVLPFLGILMAPDKIFSQAIFQPIIGLLQITEAHQLLYPLTLLFVFATLIAAGMRVLLLWGQTRLSFAIGADLSAQMYKATLYQPYATHVARNSSHVISGISSKTRSVIGSTLLPLLSVTSSSLILLAVLVALIFIQPVAALIAFVGFGSIYGLILFVARKRLARDSARISHESNQVIKALQEGLGGIRDVLIDGSQETYCQIYRQAELPMSRSQASVSIIGASPRFFIEALGMTLIAVIAYVLARSDTGIASAIPVLGALALGAQRLLPVLQQLYAGLVAMRGGQGFLHDVVKLLEQPLPDYADQPSPVPISFKASLRLSQVNFRYSELSPWVLQDIDIKIRKGSRVGFIGSTGSGKSTLLDLIMGLLQPTKGALIVDGVALTAQNQRAWQAHIAHVPQTIFLSDTSVAENIAFGTAPEKIDYPRVISAARQAQIASLIESWDDRYSTIVGERGVRLSGGQRQRIGIARALYKQADVIIFDEATSALDSDTELEVMKAINQIARNITVLIVAHRLTTLQDCDVVFELELGRVKWMGTYPDMIQMRSNEGVT